MGSKYKEIRKVEFVTKTQFLFRITRKYLCTIKDEKKKYFGSKMFTIYVNDLF